MAGTLSATMTTGHAVDAALAGGGALAAEIIESYAQTAGLTGVGGLDAIFRPLAASNGPLAGSGAFAATTKQVYATALALSGAGVLTPGLTIPGRLAGAGTLAATATGAYPKTATLTETFATKDTAKFNFASPADVSGGQLVLPANSSYGADLDTLGISLWDLTASTCHIEGVTMPNLGTGTTEASFELRKDSNNKWAFVKSGTLLYFIEKVGGTDNSTTVTYNSTTHRWWRFREASGTLYFDTAPDGSTWTTRRSMTPGLAATALFLVVNSGYYGTETTPGSAIFDNLNL